VPISAVYNQSYESTTMTVGRTPRSIQTIRITSNKVKHLNGSTIPSLSNWVVPNLASVTSYSTKCYYYNPTQGEPVKSLKFNVEYYQLSNITFQGYLILSNRSRSTGNILDFYNKPKNLSLQYQPFCLHSYISKFMKFFCHVFFYSGYSF
jgi:hypothetical protein